MHVQVIKLTGDIIKCECVTTNAQHDKNIAVVERKEVIEKFEK